ncbi:hypothetical protein [Sulfurisoma sediminicola]|uniref:Uncharacterized protein n=1 Tax=Sulfurisoma sediminicola TaxID=1381557 RepID=A0A497XK25_9PROT|nr:hypothetical protein [Sulfurisoma sediminicola]RLJ67720.1 hypothetical protein DFR35_0269 [Sulfurisoma sediminicola]
MFDSPFAYCPKCGEMVLLDQTRRECAAEHACGEVVCPLGDCFIGTDFGAAREIGGRGAALASRPKVSRRAPSR